MNEKDKIILEGSVDTGIEMTLAAADEIVGIVPGLGTAWKLSKVYYEAGLKLRHKRAIEWVEMIKDNPTVFTQSILESEEFQDGFVYSLEKYLTQRNRERRKIMKRIFCGFTTEQDKENFKLERMMTTLEQLSVEDLQILQIYKDKSIRGWYKSQFKEATEIEIDELEIKPLNAIQIGLYILGDMLGKKEFRNEDYTLERLNRLSSLGILSFSIQSAWDTSTSMFKISEFGKEFIKYIS